MDLRQLNTFLQVAELGSLSKAADRLRIAQPALSRQIRLLEEELRVALFTRHGRGMSLTGPGELLRARAAGILRQVEETRADLTEEAGTVRGHVAFGMPPTVGRILGTRLIERFRGLYPNVTLRIVLAFSGYLLDWLHGAELDIAVVYGGAPSASIRLSPLLVETLYFVTGGDAPRVSGRTVPFADLAAERLVLPGPQQGLRRIVEAEARRRGIALDVAIEADDLHILKDLALRRLGSTVLPLNAVREEVEAGRLIAAPIVEPRLSRTLVVAEPLGRPASNAARHFGDVLRAEVADMVRAGLWDGRLLVQAS